ncbi:MAG: RNA-binding S4 domain-containing protein [Gallionellaceae bacterium]|nr:RNA-binding S4 domain-containing protein [Gallionellaceae bacterium]
MNDTEKLRLDKWLWAARFFKTRSLAAAAVECGKVYVHDERVKPAKMVAPGDMLAIRLGPYQFVVEILALSAKRGPAPEAQKLYRETEQSQSRRATVAAELKAQAPVASSKPNKRERQEIQRFKRGVWGEPG